MATAAVALNWPEVDWLQVGRRLEISPQQVEIVRHILEEDLTSEAIARAMGISLRSVNTQLERLFRKLGVHTRTALAVRVMLEVMAMMREESPPGAGGEEVAKANST